MDIQFYHLTHSLERVLPKLLEKSLTAGMKTRVKCASDEQAEAMNTWLWTYNPDSFLPHGTAKDGMSEAQPVYLTASDENPNEAALFIVTDGSEIAEISGVKRVLDLVDANDEATLLAAKSRLAHYQAQGHNVSCVRQAISGTWEKQPS